MPLAPVNGSKFIVNGEEQKYESAPRPTTVEKIHPRPQLSIVVLGNQEPKTLRQHLGMNQANAPRDEVVRTQKTTSARDKKTSQYKMDLLTSKES